MQIHRRPVNGGFVSMIYCLVFIQFAHCDVGVSFDLIRGSHMFFTLWHDDSGKFNEYVYRNDFHGGWYKIGNVLIFIRCSVWQIKVRYERIYTILAIRQSLLYNCVRLDIMIRNINVDFLIPNISLAAWSTRRRFVCTHSKTKRIITQIVMLHLYTNHNVPSHFRRAIINSFLWTDAM